jgi:hypothetical protein
LGGSLGYYIRFVSTDDQPIDPAELRRVLAAGDPDYTFELGEGMTVHHAEHAIGHIDVSTPGDPRFEEQRDQLLQAATKARGRGRRRVLDALRGASAILAVEVLFGTGDTESTLVRLDPLWAWLVDHRRGMVQADGEGYYDGVGVVFRQS